MSRRGEAADESSTQSGVNVGKLYFSAANAFAK
jgi:hypothetical protein